MRRPQILKMRPTILSYIFDSYYFGVEKGIVSFSITKNKKV
jgi:hypothetical protein